MTFDFDVLKSAHGHSIFNKKEVLQSDICGCFYCLSIFKPIEIVEWTDENNPKGETALCPRCEIDSVIGEKAGFPINETFLKAMLEYWF